MVESSAGEKNLAADLAERDLSLDNDGCVGDRLGILSENSRLLESSFGELLSISEREADQRERTFRSSRSPPRKQGSSLGEENNSVHGLSSSPQLAPEARLHELFPDRMEYDRETVSHALRDGLGARAAVGPVALEHTSGSPIENRKENELDNRRENSPGSHDKVGTSPSRPFREPGEEEAAPRPEHYIPGGRILRGLERITDSRCPAIGAPEPSSTPLGKLVYRFRDKDAHLQLDVYLSFSALAEGEMGFKRVFYLPFLVPNLFIKRGTPLRK